MQQTKTEKKIERIKSRLSDLDRLSDTELLDRLATAIKSYEGCISGYNGHTTIHSDPSKNSKTREKRKMTAPQIVSQH